MVSDPEPVVVTVMKTPIEAKLGMHGKSPDS